MLRYAVLFLLCCLIACSQNKKTTLPKLEKDSPYLLRVESEESGLQGYRMPEGDTVVALGKYNYCFTDTFRTYAIVAAEEGLIAINRKEEKLFEVFMFDNGPDYVEDGYFRIVENGKIGYANTKGEVAIKPIYACASPFENGKAKVALNCTKEKDGEHTLWKSEEWFMIDKAGKKVEN